LVPYISAIGLPVFNYEGQLVACFIVVGFSQNIPSDIKHSLSQYLLDKSKEISQVCGYRM
jgi:DNA-binding IclR family transcriptional regulator